MDYLGTLWWIGVVITIVTKIAIDYLSDNYSFDICQMKKPVQIVMHLLVIICIVLVGGIPNGQIVGLSYENVVASICIVIIPAALTYCVGYAILGLNRFGNELSQICFAFVFIASIFIWGEQVYDYNVEYNRNIETITETVVETEERQLIYFCNIPVQEISGSVSGSSFLGGGRVSGNVSTSNELSYWYVGEDGKGLPDFAPTSSSSLDFFEGDETLPYIEIINHRVETTTINHNDGTERTVVDDEWTEYIFHVPEGILQFSLE